MQELVKEIPASRFRAQPRSFTRGGPVSPLFLILFLLRMVTDGNRTGIAHLLEEFWASDADAGLDLPKDQPFTAAAISQARNKLNADVFRDLLWALAQQLPGGCAARGSAKWRGRRVFAIDGQTLNTNRSPELQQTFGVPADCYSPQILCSVLSDVCSRMPIDFEVDGFAASERTHLARMLDSLEEGDLLVLDRGYPSHEVLQDLSERGLDFVIRLPTSKTFAVVDSFRDSRAAQAIVEIAPPSDSPEDRRVLKLRLVRHEGRDGVIIYLTTLKGIEFDPKAIAGLYRMRWQAEEYFKAATSNYLGQGLFRSATANGVRQELGALALFFALSRVLAGVADSRLEDPGLDAPRLQVSQKSAVLTTSRLLAKVILAPDRDSALRAIEQSLQRLKRTPYRPRPGRSFPRRSYTPQPKWGPNGRRGA